MTRTPAGRAGRNWLRHRIGLAQRAAELLELKLHGLLEEQRRLQQVADQVAIRWRSTVREAEEWALRAALAGGRRSLRLATPPRPGAVTITWATTMGVRHPARARYDAPEPDPADGHVDTGTAVVHARQGYRDAVAAGVRHAAALAATDAVAREIATTRRRLRALNQRWLPRLDAELAAITLELEERERAEDALRRRARRREA
jgi:V/A-type H+-transporting ATPase subunit D